MSSLRIEDLLTGAFEAGASDLHVTAGSAPMMRVDGDLCEMEAPVLDTLAAENMCLEIVPEEILDKSREQKEYDFAIEIPGVSRFRANVYKQSGHYCGCFRVIPYQIRSFEDLGLPPGVIRMTDQRPGLVLVTGATGSGKSTTLAAMVDKINAERPVHILTIEDPIEFVHSHKKARVSQREVGRDTESFADGLKYALREDPDVVLVGEMRDLETISKALTIAETGHLVLATLHTNSSIQTINRIIDVFPANQQGQIRTQLSFTLKGVISQKLVPTAGGKGRALVVEAMLPNSGIRSQIRDGKIHQIESSMLSGQRDSGMMTMDQHLSVLVEKKRITKDTALQNANDPGKLRERLPGGFSF